MPTGRPRCKGSYWPTKRRTPDASHRRRTAIERFSVDLVWVILDVKTVNLS